jgi:CheY-like chemotaxis protein/HPt (histidine-containing phosphotransfer) domain-containing protein
MGGQIGVESTLGKGSTFWFTAIFEKRQQPAQTSPVKHIPAGLRVLLVDDNETNRSILLRQTEVLGMRPVGAASGTQALELLCREAATDDAFTIAILDMQMPEMDGLTLARAIKADPLIAKTRLLLMTSLGPRSDTALLRAAGVGAFLVKPVKQAQLADCLVAALTATAPNETRFWQQRRDGATGSAKTLPPADGPTVHVLVAEDNAINQKVAIGLLEKLGHRAVAVANGREVLNALDLVSYDIIFMDCQLPELDGYKTTMEIRKREAGSGNGASKRPYIIAMTSYAVNGAREKCLAAGMDDYVSKPVQLDALEEALRRAIDHLGRPVTSGRNGNEPVIDTEALQVLRQLRRPDKPDPVAELIDLFVQETPIRLREMRTAATQYNAQTLAAVAHNLRGCASSIGAMQMASLCEKLEENAGRRALQVSSRLLNEIETEFDRARCALEAVKIGDGKAV